MRCVVIDNDNYHMDENVCKVGGEEKMQIEFLSLKVWLRAGLISLLLRLDDVHEKEKPKV